MDFLAEHSNTKLKSVAKPIIPTASNEGEVKVSSFIGELVLPSSKPKEWDFIRKVLTSPINNISDVDTIITNFSSLDQQKRVCTFFTTVPNSPPKEVQTFNFERFYTVGLPFMIQVALQMPLLFPKQIPIHKMRSSWVEKGKLGRLSYSLTRIQCACLLAHSFFGSLKRPENVQPNDFRFTVVDLFLGTAVSPNSACTFLNYFSVLGELGIEQVSIESKENVLTFERLGYKKGPSPWNWEKSTKLLSKVKIVDGDISQCKADVHVEFANAFVGGGVMTGDAAMEETLFLVKPELMVAMAIENRMVDEEAIRISGALQYSKTKGFGQDFEFDGDYIIENTPRNDMPPPCICAIDAIRGGGPALTKGGMLRDMNKARIGFEGANILATGHWGCGAYGNNHNLMFLKQWLAASQADVEKILYHDFSKSHSHHVHPLIRKLKHLNVSELWNFILSITFDLVPCNMKEFYNRIAQIATGKLIVPGSGEKSGSGSSGGSEKTQSSTSLSGGGDGGDGGDGGGNKQEPTTTATTSNSVDKTLSDDLPSFTLDELQNPTTLPVDIDRKNREEYLSSVDFQSIMGISKSDFIKLPQWKRNAAKKKVGLF
tara:strand:- start:364 stop:2163 length:1800 start_codon:yes stop_codon:yes gene_type:complete